MQKEFDFGFGFEMSASDSGGCSSCEAIVTPVQESVESAPVVADNAAGAAMLAEVLAEWEAAKEERRQNYLKRRKQIEDRVAADNHGKRPVVGIDGSLHAPCDGYVVHLDGSDALAYGGGQYIPVGEGRWVGIEEFGSRAKVLVPSSLADAMLQNAFFCEHLPYGSAGKSFERNGLSVCYVWLDFPPWGLKHIVDILSRFCDADIAAAALRKPAVEKPAKGEAPVGRVRVSGIVKATKDVESEYGSTIKALIELDNLATVWGTLPSRDLSRIEFQTTGARVTFTATFEQAADDKTHAFYKRPSKAVYTAV